MIRTVVGTVVGLAIGVVLLEVLTPLDLWMRRTVRRLTRARPANPDVIRGRGGF